MLLKEINTGISHFNFAHIPFPYTLPSDTLLAFHRIVQFITEYMDEPNSNKSIKST